MKALSPNALYVLCGAPLLWVSWFYAYVLRQRFYLGFWPRPAQPDPKDAGFMLHHLSIYFGALLVPIVALVAIWAIVQHRHSSSPWRLATGLLVISLVCFFAVMLVDPGSFWIWFRD